MPSTLSPPLKITLPSMRVLAPMRLSILFCGLFDLLNIASPFRPAAQLSLQRHRMRGARLARASLVNPHLHALDLRFRIDPEGPFDPSEILERQPESGRPGVRLLGEAHHNILPPLLEAHDELHAPVEVALAARARGDKQQAVAVFAGKDVGFYLEAEDRRRVAVARLRGEHALECGQFLTDAGV